MQATKRKDLPKYWASHQELKRDLENMAWTMGLMILVLFFAYGFAT